MIDEQEKHKRRIALIRNGWEHYKERFPGLFQALQQVSPSFDGYMKYNRVANHLYNQLPDALQNEVRDIVKAEA